MEKELIVENFEIEYTGGGIYVAWGQFKNKTFFSISADAMYVYDEDEYKAMDNDDYDAYEWENKHMIRSYDNYNTCEEYQYVLNQIWEKCTYNVKNEMDLFESIIEENK